MQSQNQTVWLSGQRKKDQDEDSFTPRTPGVTYTEPGRQVIVPSGLSVEDTLKLVGVTLDPTDLLRLGSDQVHDFQRITQDGEYLTRTKNIRAGMHGEQ
jgi:hypothetical protein